MCGNACPSVTNRRLTCLSGNYPSQTIWTGDGINLIRNALMYVAP